MKLNDRFSLDRDKYQFILTEHWEVLSKRGKNVGKMTKQKKETYHSTLRQVANHILNVSAEKCDSLEMLIERFEQAAESIEKALSGVKC